MNKKGFAPIAIILIIVGILIVAGGVWYWQKTKVSAPAATPTPSATSTQSAPASSSVNKSHTLSLCGINVIVKTGQSVKTNTGNITGLQWGQLIIGDAMPNSDLEIVCKEKNKNPQSETEKLMNDVSYVLGIQSAGSSKVSKSLYTVFDKQTLSNITDLYSAKDRGFRAGSETIGFSTQNWIYTFYFLNPEEAKNQNSFIISVNP